MIVIMVGQGLLGRKQELQSEEQFNTTIKTYHDIEQIMAHLAVQDEELLRQTHMIIHLMKATGVAVEDFLEEREKLLDTTPQASGNSALPAHEAISI